jgi:hypothetical protein
MWAKRMLRKCFWRHLLLLLTLGSTAAIAQSPTSDTTKTFWDHNGSIVYLLADGAAREFHYSEPRESMIEAGAQPDSLLFKGKSINGLYVGTAYIFNRRCGQIPYDVSGPILDAYVRVVLRGQAPRVGAGCRITGYLTDTLEFTLLKLGQGRSSSSSDANALPAKFLGGWTKSHQTGGNDSIPITGISVGPRSYHEPGYNCEINKVTGSADTADDADRVYIVDMTCQDDGYQPPPAQRVHEVWAMRNINGKDLLITSGASSIQVLQRE